MKGKFQAERWWNDVQVCVPRLFNGGPIFTDDHDTCISGVPDCSKINGILSGTGMYRVLSLSRVESLATW